MPDDTHRLDAADTVIAFDQQVNDTFLLVDALRGLTHRQVLLIRDASVDDLAAAHQAANRQEH